MSYFAKVENGVVVEVISADQSFIDSGAVGDPSAWIQTSYNTKGGIHYAPSPPAEPMTPDGGVALRANYAGVGYTYDAINDVFYPPRPLDFYGNECLSWTISAPTWLWQPPIPYPNDGKNYVWDESTLSWQEITD